MKDLNRLQLITRHTMARCEYRHCRRMIAFFKTNMLKTERELAELNREIKLRNGH